ncbi:subunit sigma of DNA-directed RNA polymerase [Paenibacillus sp. 32O-W]|uniref:DUF1835 domain-containing protein n=1 Tax=Paenibacillus sp. 32O-W TaxID=1695218 RepID=UPI000722062A|nr:DUF1835 domain-containing protein [Paenibacillus sp. 32O-W]ALS28682.1 subunit sigma of DNA-directed RNA polymerase [Paenibacillus sp. 32O-W]
MLHIVNGDTVAAKLKQGAVRGDILVWREIYSEGPVFPDLSEPAGRALRADYLENALRIPHEEYIEGCRSQEQRLSRFRDYDEIVLWFEHDLFDQTMLCCLLHWFSRQSLGQTTLNLLCIGSFPGIEPFLGLGQLTVEQLKTLSGTWHPVGRRELELGRACWEAYASPDPRHLVRLLQGDVAALPFVREAFRFHLSRFPSLRNGLGIVETTTLEEVRRGLQQPLALFRQTGERLHWFGMGDIQYWHILEQMASGPHPLIRIEDAGDAMPGCADSAPSPEFRNARVVLTEAGRRVLDGEEDRVALNGIDCWLGGVRLQGKERIWRWDDAGETIVMPGADEV